MNDLLFFNKFILCLDSSVLSPTLCNKESRRIQLASLRFTHDPLVRTWSFVPRVKKPGEHFRNNSQRLIPMCERHGMHWFPHDFIAEISLHYLGFFFPLPPLGLVEKVCRNLKSLWINAFIYTFLCSRFQMQSMHNSLLSSSFPVSPQQRFVPVSSASFFFQRDLFPT